MDTVKESKVVTPSMGIEVVGAVASLPEKKTPEELAAHAQEQRRLADLDRKAIQANRYGRSRNSWRNAYD